MEKKKSKKRMIKIQSLIIYSSCVVLGSVIFTEASAANLRIIGYGKVCCLFVYIGHSYILTHWLTGLLFILINPSIHSHPTVHTDIQLVGGLFRFKQVTGQRVIQPLNVECTGHSSNRFGLVYIKIIYLKKIIVTKYACAINLCGTNNGQCK